MAKAHIRQEGDRVIASIDGKVIDLPWQAALELSRAFASAGRKAEEHAKHGVIIADSAILMRAGMPFTLTNNPRMLDAAKTEAVHNRDLRRFMPGIKSQEVVGTPSLIQHQPTKEQLQ